MASLLSNSVPRITVNVGENEYQLKTMIGGYQRRQLSQTGILLQSTFAEIRNPQDNSLVYYRMNTADAELAMLEVYLVSWSHDENITKKNLQRLPPSDWDVLIEKIQELQKEQWGPAEDSPLAKSSTTSSGKASSGEKAQD